MASPSEPPATHPPPYTPRADDNDPNSTFRNIITSMLHSRHHKFGFLIYRVNYENDAIWHFFLDVLHRQNFDGATKDEIREFFRDWVHERSEERDGPGAGTDNEDLIRWSPRYKVCMYADKEVIEGATIRTVTYLPGGPKLHVQGIGILIDGQYDEHDRDVLVRAAGGWREEFKAVEGRTRWDVGWLRFNLRGVHCVYETLCMSEEEWTSPYFYRRPPRVWNGFS
ncbi:hypothetical protein QBC34DRAFT_379243 [Podospora aff. communis PSN243]|uniref:Uncharacterized protein n=1 Tax=Podospora aff. communis PSN243 TaxID=3040156 RepID=A0AAV9GSK0_9PEZI|nr:hypothetical protein QBC34DRAFT_379243 [Podospora aff. communis PSN243]